MGHFIGVRLKEDLFNFFKRNLVISNFLTKRFVVSNVSPAVVVPYMIVLEEKRLGTNKNIPSLAIASSCLDNIFAITGNSLIIGIIFNKGF